MENVAPVPIHNPTAWPEVALTIVAPFDVWLGKKNEHLCTEYRWAIGGRRSQALVPVPAFPQDATLDETLINPGCFLCGHMSIVSLPHKCAFC